MCIVFVVYGCQKGDQIYNENIELMAKREVLFAAYIHIFKERASKLD